MQVLASYFVLLPIRDEAGVSLGESHPHPAITLPSCALLQCQRADCPMHVSPGTEVLPTLFCLSLVVTLIATPLTAEFLLRPNVPRCASCHATAFQAPLCLRSDPVAAACKPPPFLGCHHASCRFSINKLILCTGRRVYGSFSPSWLAPL